jgi:hypothetical protein
MASDDNPIRDQDELDLAVAGWEALTRRRDDLQRRLDGLDRRAAQDRAWGNDTDFIRARQLVYSKIIAMDEALLEAELWMARAAGDGQRVDALHRRREEQEARRTRPVDRGEATEA